MPAKILLETAMTEQSAVYCVFTNSSHSPDTEEYEIALNPLSKSPTTEENSEKLLSTESYYQDIEEKGLSSVYQTLSNKNEPQTSSTKDLAIQGLRRESS